MEPPRREFSDGVCPHCGNPDARLMTKIRFDSVGRRRPPLPAKLVRCPDPKCVSNARPTE